MTEVGLGEMACGGVLTDLVTLPREWQEGARSSGWAAGRDLLQTWPVKLDHCSSTCKDYTKTRKYH